jgi:hypothetical protein
LTCLSLLPGIECIKIEAKASVPESVNVLDPATTQQLRSQTDLAYTPYLSGGNREDKFRFHSK